MANELSINLRTLSFSKSTIAINIAPLPTPLLVTVTGVHTMHDQLTLSTSDATLNKGNIGTIGFVYVKNLDSSANIQMGHDGTTFLLVLKPGEYGFFRWNSAAFHAKSSSGTPILEYMFIED